MVMSSEAKENTRNGKSRGNSPNSIKSTDSKLPADNLTPEVSDDDNSNTFDENFHRSEKINQILFQ